jgi:hypothetical protein
MIHICEFTADLIRHGKLKLDPSRNDHWKVTFHDSCNPARAMGLLEEPRYILRHVCNHFYEMPENTIREQTFCCGSGSGLGTDENLEMRACAAASRAPTPSLRAGPHGVNLLACICAIDKATLPPLLEYWTPGVEVAGVHELVGNALVIQGVHEGLAHGTPEPTGGTRWFAPNKRLRGQPRRKTFDDEPPNTCMTATRQGEVLRQVPQLRGRQPQLLGLPHRAQGGK